MDKGVRATKEQLGEQLIARFCLHEGQVREQDAVASSLENETFLIC